MRSLEPSSPADPPPRSCLLGELDAAVAGLVDTDFGALSGAELSVAVQHLQRLRNRFDSVDLDALRALENSGQCGLEKASSVPAWLRHRCRVPVNQARRRVRLARKAPTMPSTHAALKTGVIGLAHVDRLSRANQRATRAAFMESEEMLVGFAVSLLFEEFSTAVGQWQQLADPADPLDKTEKAHAKNEFHASETLDGRGRLDGWLDADDFAAFTTVLRDIERALLLADWQKAKNVYGDDVTADKLHRTAPQRRAAALVEMAARAATAPSDGKRPEPIVVIHLSGEQFALGAAHLFGLAELVPHLTSRIDLTDPRSRLCECEDGTVVAASHAVAIALAGHVQRIVFDSPGHILDFGHRKRFYTGGLRDAIKYRDRFCQDPGCAVLARYCDIDHAIEHQDGGPTSHENGVCRCTTGHRHKTLRTKRTRQHHARESDPDDDLHPGC